MPDLTPEQFTRVLDALRAMNPYAHIGAQPDAVREAFAFDGYLNIDGLFALAEVMVEIRREQMAALFPPEGAPCGLDP